MAKGSQKTQAIIQFVGEDAYSKHTDKLKKDLEGVEKKGADVGATFHEWSTGLNAAIELGQKFAGTLKDAAAFAREGALATASSAQFARNFENVAGSMERMRKASRGAIDNTSLEKFALKLGRAGLEMGQVVKILEQSAKLSVETGETVIQTGDNLFKAISSGRTRQLQNLGVQIDFVRALKEQKEALGRTVGPLTQAEKAAARYAETVKEVGKATANISTPEALRRIDEATGRWGNFVSELQERSADLFGKLAEISDELHVFDRILTLEGALDAGMADLQVTLNSMPGTLSDFQQHIEDSTRAMLAQEIAAKDLNQSHVDAVKKLVDQKNAQFEMAMALASTAAEMGHAKLATEKYTEAMKLADDTGGSIIDREQKKADAIRGTTTELRRQLAMRVQFEMFDLEEAKPGLSGPEIARRESEIKILTDRLIFAESALDEVVSKSVDVKGKKGRRRKNPFAGFGSESAGDVFANMGRRGSLADFQEEDRAAGASAEAEAAQVGQTTIDIMNAKADATRAAREEVDGLSDSFEAFGGTLGTDWVDNLRQTSIVIEDEIGRVTGVFSKATAAGLNSGQAMAKSAPGMIKAFGNIAGALGASIEVQETIYGFADVAQSATKFAGQDYVGGAAFAVSAGLHFAAAGVAGSKGKSGGGGGRRAGIRPPEQQAPEQEARGPVVIHQNFGGAAFVGPGGVREASRALTGMVEGEQSAGSHSADFAAAG